MQVASRIRRSWAGLADRLMPLSPESFRFLETFQDWARLGPQSVSRKAADRVSKAKGIALLVGTPACDLPATRGAVSKLSAALAHPTLPRDPVAFVDFVDSLCWQLAVFHRCDDACPACGDGDLELWTDGGRCFQICDSLGHCFSESDQRVDAPPGLRPARLSEVRSLFSRYADQLAVG